eukprot:364426-Chlamydomonas_euryale.AAC.23
MLGQASIQSSQVAVTIEVGPSAIAEGTLHMDKTFEDLLEMLRSNLVKAPEQQRGMQWKQHLTVLTTCTVAEF